VAALLGGFIPTCVYRDCHHRKIKWENPFFIQQLREKTNLYIICPNGWALGLLLPFMDREQRELNLKLHDMHEWLASEIALNWLKEKVKGKVNNYFIYFHVMETHPPFFTPETKGWKISEIERFRDGEWRRRRALEWVDEFVVGEFLTWDYDCLIVTSDHALKHNCPEGLNVFIATDFRSEKCYNIWQF